VGYADFCRLIQKCADITLVIFRVAGPILIKFAQYVATVLPLNIFESELPYSYPFRNASLPNKFRSKLVAIAMSLEESEKEVQIGNLQTNIYHLLKNIS